MKETNKVNVCVNMKAFANKTKQIGFCSFSSGIPTNQLPYQPFPFLKTLNTTTTYSTNSPYLLFYSNVFKLFTLF